MNAHRVTKYSTTPMTMAMMNATMSQNSRASSTRLDLTWSWVLGLGSCYDRLAVTITAGSATVSCLPSFEKAILTVGTVVCIAASKGSRRDALDLADRAGLVVAQLARQLVTHLPRDEVVARRQPEAALPVVQVALRDLLGAEPGSLLHLAPQRALAAIEEAGRVGVDVLRVALEPPHELLALHALPPWG